MNERGGACKRVRPQLAELALGALDGRTRGEVLTHLDGCTACAAEAAGLAATADLLCELPPATPPPGRLERVVLAAGRVGRSGRRWRMRRRLFAGAVAVAVTGGGVAIGVLAFAGSTAGHPAVATAAGTAGPPASGAAWPLAGRATLTSDLRAPSGAVLGTVALHPGAVPTLVVRLRAVPAPVVDCVVRTRDGRRLRLGAYPASQRTWTAALPVAADLVTGAELRTPGGVLLGHASLAW